MGVLSRRRPRPRVWFRVRGGVMVWITVRVRVKIMLTGIMTAAVTVAVTVCYMYWNVGS